MNQLLKFTSYFLIFQSIIACQNQSTPVTEKEVATAIEPTKKQTQALILTQPFDYDPSDKNKVTGDYIAQNKLVIPNNLATQSKWIMFEGPVLENDLVAYRYYADSRHRFDIYSKSVTDLVMDTVSWNYHNIMDWGSDVLKVGNSLGIGSPAIYYQDSLHTLFNVGKKELMVVKNGDKRSILRTTFTDLAIGGQKFDLEQDWTIEAGNYYTTIYLKVTKGQLPEGASFATGIVKHLDTVKTGQTDKNFYAYTWGKQSFHKDNLGMAIFADIAFQPTAIADKLSHVYVFKNAANEVKYSFLSAWEKGNSSIQEEGAFERLVAEAAK